MDEREKKISAIRSAMVEAAAREGCSLDDTGRIVKVMAVAALDAIEPRTRYEIGGGLALQKDADGWWFYRGEVVVTQAHGGIAEAVIALLKDRV